MAELKRCLKAIAKFSDTDFEVFVGVDGSTDGSIEWLGKTTFSFPLKLLTHPESENKGRSATRNLPLGELSGQYILYLDSDMIPSPDLLEQHRKVVEKGNAISIGSVHYLESEGNCWVRYTAERGVAKFNAGELVPFNYFITPNVAIPAAWVKAVGGFDEKINRYGGEDMELGYRLEQQFKPAFVYNPAARVETVQEKRLSKALKELEEYGATGLIYINRKHKGLEHIYWIDKCTSSRLKDRLFRFLQLGIFRLEARILIAITPFVIKKHLISYLVVCSIHKGYRKGLRNA